MTELRKLGFEISIYPIVKKTVRTIHPEALSFMDSINTIPFFSAKSFFFNCKFALCHPFLYFQTLFLIIRAYKKNLKMLMKSLSVFGKAAPAAGLMKKEGIEHIHAHFATHAALYAWIIHRFSGIPFSFTAHAHDIYLKKHQPLLANKINEAKFVITISQYNQNFLSSLLGDAVTKKIHVVHCGVRQEKYTVSEIRKTIGEKIEILSIGSLRDYKGQTYLIRACQKLEQAGIPFICRIIGSGELESELENEIASLGLSDLVILEGSKNQDEVINFLAEANCYIQPSIITGEGRMEGIPVAMMEAGSSSLPIIATDISGISELIKNEFNGILIPEKDFLAIYNAVIYLHDHPDLARQFGETCRKTIVNDFSLSTESKKLAGLFLDRSV
jgi:glycosyltransferase involved in cell wall biosynthesis